MVKPNEPISDNNALPALLQQAQGVLDRLNSHRELIEQRQVETGQSDPIREITGTSALERAILDAKNMVLNIETMLNGSTNGSSSSDPPVVATLPERLTRATAGHVAAEIAT